MAQDLIIGAVHNYNYDQIKHWANSIDKSGYTGAKALIAYSMDADTAKKLADKGFNIFAFTKDENDNLSYSGTSTPRFNTVVERFAHLWHFINQIDDDIEYVIATDVKDVVFQTNPSDYVRKAMPKDTSYNLLVGAENFLYKNEPWNVDNMNLAFGPKLYEMVENRPIYCAGVIAGTRQAFADLCLNVFMLCRGSDSHTQGGGGPDQAALNILLNLEAYWSITNFTTPRENGIVHLGTTLPAILSGAGTIGEAYMRDPSLLDKFKETMLYEETKINDDLVCNYKDEPYCIVHQYDRVKGLKEKIHAKFGD